MEILCFFAGVAFFYTKSIYSLLLIVIGLYFRVTPAIMSWFVAGIVWSYVHQWLVTDQGMPAERLIPKATLIGQVVSIPTNQRAKTQFQFSVTSLNNKPVQAEVLLTCYNRCPSINAGQYWRFDVKLKRPENLGNPGCFDIKTSLAARHIHWTGYLKNGEHLLLPNGQFNYNMLMRRQYLADSLQAIIPNPSSLGIVQALTLGVTKNIDKSQWDLFRRTGTTHLMVISGSHIALIAGVVYWLVGRLWSSYSQFCLYRPAAQIAGIASLVTAIAYSWLAGFAVPAQRSLIASIFLLLPHFLNHRFTGWQSWRYALLGVLLVEPHAVLMSGFYLSFIAVALLMAVSSRIPYRGISHGFFLQLACLFGLLPFTLYWFSYGALTGLLANLIAIPWVGYLIVPLSLLTLIVNQCLPASMLTVPLDWSINALLIFLKAIDSVESLNLTMTLSGMLALIGLMLAMGLVVFLPLKPLLPSAFIIIVLAFFPRYPKVAIGEARVDVLDVGQGLSIVVNTARHTLIYDTGMQFFQGSDMAQMAILPYLQILGIKKIDKVVISHPDLDHLGGLHSLEEKYPIDELLVDNPSFYHRGKPCHNYPAWQWDGVDFQFLPIKLAFRDKNNSSCVLQIRNQAGSVLLTGDIEKLAERYLLKTYQTHLAADVLIVAHHGSKTSSSKAFIDTVAPRFAIISAGFDNRYHFPHQETLTTFETRGIHPFNTIDCGMVTVTLSLKLPLQPKCFRKMT